MKGTVIITGAGGYVGPHVVTALLDAGVPVTAVLRPGSKAELDSRARIEYADILDPSFEVAGWAGAAGLVHLAWKDGFAHNSSAHMGQLSSHYRLLTGAADIGVRRIVALGTMHEIGYWEGAIDESTPTDPLSQYGIAKDALRRSLSIALSDRASLAWVRCYYIYGDDRRNRSIFMRLLEAADAGQRLFPFTTGHNRYDFIRVEELGRQIAAVYRSDATGVINCATGVPVSLAEKVEDFISENGLEIALDYGVYPDRPYDSPGVWADVTRIQQIVASGD